MNALIIFSINSYKTSAWLNSQSMLLLDYNSNGSQSKTREGLWVSYYKIY